jgi:hypothetical protein
VYVTTGTLVLKEPVRTGFCSISTSGGLHVLRHTYISTATRRTIHPPIRLTVYTHPPTDTSIHPSIHPSTHSAFNMRSAKIRTCINFYGYPKHRLKNPSGKHQLGDLSIDGRVMLHVRKNIYMRRNAYGAFALLWSKNCSVYRGKSLLDQTLFCLT